MEPKEHDKSKQIEINSSDNEFGFEEGSYFEVLNQEIPTIDSVLKRGIILSKETKNKLDQLTQETSLNHTTSGIGLFYQQAKSLQEKITSIVAGYDEFKEQYSAKMPAIEELVSKLAVYTVEIRKREEKLQHMRNIALLDQLSSYVLAALVIDDFKLASGSFAELSTFTEKMLASEDTEGAKTSKDKLLHFYDLLKGKITNDFDESLELLNWPFISSSKSKSLEQTTLTEEEILEQFEKNFCHLVQIKLPDHMMEKEDFTGPLSRDWKPILPPIAIMLEPLCKRFRYHFSGDRKTNRLDKPEWYMTQVLTWIKDHETFLSITVQPCMSKINMSGIDVKLEFVRGLVSLVLTKMQADLELMSDTCDDDLFSHLLDEALSLDSELRIGFSYPKSLPCPSDVFTADIWFQRWLSVERKFATSKLDELFVSKSAWESITQDIKRPECCEEFLGLLLAMTGRARRLRSLTRRAQFHRLQLGLIDDFRLRLAQVTKTTKPVDRRWGDVINALHGVRETLVEWADDPFYVEFWEDESARYLCQQSISFDGDVREEGQGDLEESKISVKRLISETTLSDDPLYTSLAGLGMEEQQSVFANPLRLYEHMSREMLASLVRSVMDDVSASSRGYRRARWMSLPGAAESCLGLSPTACEMLLVLRDRLHMLQESLVGPLFARVWQTLASKINIFFYQKVILKNHFNSSGAAQIRFDLTKNLIPLFALYTRKPEVYFREVREAIILLCLAQGSALLLKDTLYASLHSSSSTGKRGPGQSGDPVAALRDVGVHRLSLDEAELVLSLRVTDDVTHLT